MMGHWCLVWIVSGHKESARRVEALDFAFAFQYFLGGYCWRAMLIAVFLAFS